MRGATSSGKTNSRREGQPRPYAPSWVDLFTAWVARRPGPKWAYYLGIGLILVLIPSGILWGEGVYAVGTFLGIHGFLAAMIVFFPVLIHYLDGAAARALVTLRPILRADEGKYEELRYRLTTLPGLPTLTASLIAALANILITETLGAPAGFELAGGPFSSASTYAMYVLAWGVWGAFVYHTIHQLRVINHIYTDHTHVSVFRVRPLYAFSSATAITAVALTIPTYAWLAINRGLRDPTSIALTIPVTALALVAFAWPQLGVRRLLAEEKAQMLDALSQRVEAAIADLRQRTDGRDVEGIDHSIKVLEALGIEEKALKKVSTWPWQPETVRYLVSALLLPLILWLVQFVLQRILSP